MREGMGEGGMESGGGEGGSRKGRGREERKAGGGEEGGPHLDHGDHMVVVQQLRAGVRR